MSVREVADAIGRPPSTYSSYEDKYKKPYLPVDLIKRLEKVLVPRGIPVSELQALGGYQPANMLLKIGINRKNKSLRGGAEVEMIKLDELDIRAAAGVAGVDPAEISQHVPVVAEWNVPRPWLQQIAPGPAPNLKIITVAGDSMTPDFQPNQRVLVDIADLMPTPSGIFVVWDGLGLAIKRVQFIPFSEPPRVEISSINTAYKPYERILGEAYIQGRVVGRWQPT